MPDILKFRRPPAPEGPREVAIHRADLARELLLVLAGTGPVALVSRDRTGAVARRVVIALDGDYFADKGI